MSNNHDNDMTNKELAAEIAHRMGITPYQSMKFLSTMADVINENASNGHGTKIGRVGTVSVRAVSERESRDISTGEKIVIPRHHVVKFAAARRLKITIRDADSQQ